MDARRMTPRDIEDTIKDIYGAEVRAVQPNEPRETLLTAHTTFYI